MGFKTDGLQTHHTRTSCEEINDFQGQRSACVPVTHYISQCVFLFLRWELPNRTVAASMDLAPLPSARLGLVFAMFAYARLILLMGSLIKCVGGRGGGQLKRGIDKQSP